MLSTRLQVHKILQSEDPIALLGLTNISNIVIGPVHPKRDSVMHRYPKFTIQDKLLRSKGVVEVVSKHELHMNGIILHSVIYASSLLITVVLLALVVALLLWLVVRKIKFFCGNNSTCPIELSYFS